jgi:hypothetical protein
LFNYSFQRIDLKIQAASSSSARTKKLEKKQQNATLTSADTAAPTENLLNKNLGHVSRHFEVGNSSEESGYIQAISPAPPSPQRHGSRHNHQHQQEQRPAREHSPRAAAAAAAPFSPPAGCAVEIERDNKQPKIRLKDSWDGLVMLHSPKTQQQEGNDGGEQVAGGDGGRQDHRINDGNDHHAATGSPRLLNHHQYHNHGHHSHHSTHRSLGAISQEDRETNTSPAAAPATAAAIQPINEVDPELDGLLATPQSLLENISRLVAINDQEHVISALVLLTRGVKYHKEKLDQCLGELLAVVTACLQSRDDKVVVHALQAGTEMVRMYGDSLLQHMHMQYVQQQATQQGQQGHQQDGGGGGVFLLQLLLCASRTSPSSIKSTSDALLKRIASTMHQASIVKLLEPFAARSGNSGNSNSCDSSTSAAIQNKAASTLLIATYRLS